MSLDLQLHAAQATGARALEDEDVVEDGDAGFYESIVCNHHVAHLGVCQ